MFIEHAKKSGANALYSYYFSIVVVLLVSLLASGVFRIVYGFLIKLVLWNMIHICFRGRWAAFSNKNFIKTNYFLTYWHFWVPNVRTSNFHYYLIISKCKLISNGVLQTRKNLNILSNFLLKQLSKK